MKIYRLTLVAAVLVSSVLWSGCAPLLSVLQTETPIPSATETPTTQSKTVTPPQENSSSSPATCAYVWDSRPLDLETTMVQAAYKAKSMDNVNVRLQAYGENCVQVDTNQIVSFTTMETDFYLTIDVGSLDDVDALGNQLAGSLQVLRSFPADTFPGPNPSRVFVTFDAAGQIQNLSFDMQQAGSALDKGLTGTALMAALGFITSSPSATPAR